MCSEGWSCGSTTAWKLKASAGLTYLQIKLYDLKEKGNLSYETVEEFLAIRCDQATKLEFLAKERIWKQTLIK